MANPDDPGALTKFAAFHHEEPAPQKVYTWYDIETHDYELPPFADLFALTDEQWNNRMTKDWAVNGNQLVEWIPPPPVYTIEDQARMLLAGPVVVECAANPAIDGEYSITEARRQAMIGVMSQINAGMGVPGGGQFTEPPTTPRFNWPDKDNNEKLWSEAEFRPFAHAVTNFVYNCTQVINGFSTTLPSNVIPIVAVARSQ